MTWKTIFNPFEKYSERQLLIASVLITILGSLIGSYCQVIYDGFLDVHSYENTFSHVVLENVINGMVMTIFLFALGKIINNKTRFIDAQIFLIRISFCTIPASNSRTNPCLRF